MTVPTQTQSPAPPSPPVAPPVAMPFRWTTRNREFDGKVFFAATPEEFVVEAFATIDAVTSMTGRAELELQSRSYRHCDYERYQASWHLLPGPLFRRQNEGDPAAARKSVWPNDMGRLEEELHAAADDVFAEAVTFYAPTKSPELAAPGESADAVLPIDTI